MLFSQSVYKTYLSQGYLKKMKTFTDDQNIQTTVVHLENVEKKVHVEV